jgi:hypothetical protein
MKTELRKMSTILPGDTFMINNLDDDGTYWQGETKHFVVACSVYDDEDMIIHCYIYNGRKLYNRELNAKYFPMGELVYVVMSDA